MIISMISIVVHNPITCFKRLPIYKNLPRNHPRYCRTAFSPQGIPPTKPTLQLFCKQPLHHPRGQWDHPGLYRYYSTIPPFTAHNSKEVPDLNGGTHSFERPITYGMYKNIATAINEATASTYPEDLVEFQGYIMKKTEEFERFGGEYPVVWVHVQDFYAKYLPVLRKCGYVMHRIEDNFIILYKWIRRGHCGVPESGTHIAGACGMVIRSTPSDGHKKQVLLIREKYRSHRWEFPTGSVERGEYFIQTAQKEVKEEVKLDVEVLGMVGMINDINNRYGRNNVLMCFACKMINEEDEPSRNPAEVVELSWIDLDVIVKEGEEFKLNDYPIARYVANISKAYVESGFQLMPAKKIGNSYYYLPPKHHEL